MKDQLLTLAEAAKALRLRTADNFVRFARRHRIPIVRLGHRVVRVRQEDLEQAVRNHVETHWNHGTTDDGAKTVNAQGKGT